MDNRKTIALGIGTGRNGSESLADLLNAQAGGCFSHEFGLFSVNGERSARYRPPLAWNGSLEEARATLEGLTLYRGDHVGDIGMYWLPYLPALCREFPALRVIAIYRDRDSVIRSYLKKTEGRNHWTEHDGSEYRLDPLWDPVFPNYPQAPKPELLGRYWDDYRDQTEALQNDFPDQVRSWPMQALNDPDKVSDILAHVGFKPDDIKTLSAQRRNQGRPSLLKNLLKRLAR